MIRYFYKNIRSKKLIELENYKQGSWVYVENPSDTEIETLVRKFKLDQGHIDDARDEDEMPRLEKEGELVYLFTRYATTKDDTQISTMPLLFIMGPDILMTISLSPVPRLERFIEGKIDFTTTQRTKLVLQIMDQIVDQYAMYLNSVSRHIKTIRSRLRVEEIRNQDFVNFVLIEDELNEFLSTLVPTNAIFRRLLLGKYVKLYENDQDIVEDLLLNNEQSIESCRSNLKTIVNIREAYSTIMSNNLNSIIRILTVVTVMIEVPTLISGIFGMNVGLPFSEARYMFSAIITFSLLLSLFLLWIFRKKDWL